MDATFAKPYLRKVSIRTVSSVASLRRSMGSFASSRRTCDSFACEAAALVPLIRLSCSLSMRSRSCAIVLAA